MLAQHATETPVPDINMFVKRALNPAQYYTAS